MSESFTALGPTDAPAIVFIHGTRLSRGAWHPQLVGLAGGFRVVALDLPGHGALRDRPFGWEEAVAEILRVIDEAAGGRATLVGLSLGGYLAMDVAARAPERVAGLVIVGSSAEPGGLVGLGIDLLAASLTRIPDRTLDRFDRAFFRWRYPGPTADVLRAGGFAHAAAVAGLRELRPRRFGRLLAAYPGPILILNGALDLPFRLSARRFGRSARDSRVAVIRGATHLANLDRPSAFSSAVARFVAEVARSGPRAESRG